MERKAKITVFFLVAIYLVSWFGCGSNPSTSESEYILTKIGTDTLNFGKEKPYLFPLVTRFIPSYREVPSRAGYLLTVSPQGDIFHVFELSSLDPTGEIKNGTMVKKSSVSLEIGPDSLPVFFRDVVPVFQDGKQVFWGFSFFSQKVFQFDEKDSVFNQIRVQNDTIHPDYFINTLGDAPLELSSKWGLVMPFFPSTPSDDLQGVYYHGNLFQILDPENESPKMRVIGEFPDDYTEDGFWFSSIGSTPYYCLKDEKTALVSFPITPKIAEVDLETEKVSWITPLEAQSFHPEPFVGIASLPEDLEKYANSNTFYGAIKTGKIDNAQWYFRLVLHKTTKPNQKFLGRPVSLLFTKDPSGKWFEHRFEGGEINFQNWFVGSEGVYFSGYIPGVNESEFKVEGIDSLLKTIPFYCYHPELK